VKALEKIIGKYPQYVPMATLEATLDSDEARESLRAFLGELAFLQVLIVK